MARSTLSATGRWRLVCGEPMRSGFPRVRRTPQRVQGRGAPRVADGGTCRVLPEGRYTHPQTPISGLRRHLPPVTNSSANRPDPRACSVELRSSAPRVAGRQGQHCVPTERFISKRALLTGCWRCWSAPAAAPSSPRPARRSAPRLRSRDRRHRPWQPRSSDRRRVAPITRTRWLGRRTSWRRHSAMRPWRGMGRPGSITATCAPTR